MMNEKHEKSNRAGAIVVYLLILAAGLGVGLYFGRTFLPIGLVKLFHRDTTVVRNAVQSQVVAATVNRDDPLQEQVSHSRQNAIVNATRNVSPGVVGIVVTQIQVVRNPYYSNDFFDLFFAPHFTPKLRQVENMGSGFVIREDGLILTNYHVIEGAAKLYVNFSDGRQREGTVVGVDASTDIAVVKVQEQKFTPVQLGNSSTLMIGEWAIAIGNPFLNFINDAHPTVTVGVVSALDRNFAPSEGVYYQGMIQTDAAINPGNSGGPLVNVKGQVIGINTFIYTGSTSNRGSIGIGFAIPINRAKRVADELIKFGKRRQVWTGISVQNLTRSIALALGIENLEGVVVVNVAKGSPGDKAGLKRGDVLVRMGKRVVSRAEDLEGFFLDFFVGDDVPLVYKRGSAEKKTRLVLEEYGR